MCRIYQSRGQNSELGQIDKNRNCRNPEFRIFVKFDSNMIFATRFLSQKPLDPSVNETLVS